MAPRFAYAPIGARPPIRWPDDRRLAVWLVPNVEHYELEPSVRGVREAWSRTGPPDGLDYPRKDYGNRVGLDRFLDLTDRLSIPCTVSLSLAVPSMYPASFARMHERGWDFMCHGLYNTHYLWNYPVDDERAFIADCQDRMRAVTGERIRGWFSPACSHTVNTPDLVAEAGIDYYCDLYHDDQPFPVRTRTGSLITIPYSMDVNDAVLHAAGADGDAFEQVIRDQFDRLHAESADAGRVMCIACHPYLSCQPQRVRAFERALRHVCSHDDIWLATGAEIAGWYRRHHLEAVQAWLTECGR